MSELGAWSERPSGSLLRATLAVVVASCVVVLSSVDVYLIEDSSRRVSGAYRADLMLNATYVAIYATALGVGVLALVAAGRFAVAWWRTPVPHASALLVLCVSVVALAGLWGLAIRHPVAFIELVAALAVFVLVTLLTGRAVVTRWSREPATDPLARDALAACVAAAVGMAVNVGLTAAHTVIMRGAGEALYATTVLRLAGVAFSELAFASAMAAVFTLVAGCLVSWAMLARSSV